MCGIVGYIGEFNTIPNILSGLQRLEYRGYDSAGICFKNTRGNISVYKTIGKIENLISKVSVLIDTPTIGMGHTRWATHGEISEKNAHPHTQDNIALVHNGIIENAESLKKLLLRQGVKFNSEVDSEIFLHLLLKELCICSSKQEAIGRAFSKLKGNSAFLIQFDTEDQLWAIKKGAPLLCGFNSYSNEAWVSSDAISFSDRTKEIYCLNDNIVYCISNYNSVPYLQFDLKGTSSNKEVIKRNSFSFETPYKGFHDHYTIKEILEQPARIRALLDFYDRNIDLPALKTASHIYLIGCGTAYYASRIIEYYVKKYLCIPCTSYIASEFDIENVLVGAKDVALFISQSGETADTLKAQEMCAQRKIKTISITNTEYSTLYRVCEENYLIHAGLEIGVASTKAFTQQVLTGIMLVATCSGTSVLLKNFKSLASYIEKLLITRKNIENLAKDLYTKDLFLFLGRGIYFSIASEGALKLKELAYVHAEAFPSGELKHGPLALVSPNSLSILIMCPKNYDRNISTLEEIKARKGQLLIIGDKSLTSNVFKGMRFIPAPFTALEELTALYINVILQLFAYYIAKFKGCSIDQPRNLAKSVTVG